MLAWARGGGSAKTPAARHPDCSPHLPLLPSQANEPSPLHLIKAMS